MFGYEEHPYGFYTMAGMTGDIFRSRTIYVGILCSLLLLLNFTYFYVVFAIVLVGLLYGFFIAIICGQRINERHYHVLAKQELTKVWYLILETFRISNTSFYKVGFKQKTDAKKISQHYFSGLCCSRIFPQWKIFLDVTYLWIFCTLYFWTLWFSLCSNLLICEFHDIGTFHNFRNMQWKIERLARMSLNLEPVMSQS